MKMPNFYVLFTKISLRVLMLLLHADTWRKPIYANQGQCHHATIDRLLQPAGSPGHT